MDTFSEQLSGELLQQFIAADQQDEIYADIEGSDMVDQAEGYAQLAKHLFLSGSNEK